MKMASRKLQIAVLLPALLWSGSVYAGEVVLTETFEASGAAFAEPAFATLQFEIDSVDSALPLSALIERRSQRFGCETRLPGVDFGSASLARHAGPSARSSGASVAAEFWQRLDTLTGQRFELFDAEDRILAGATAAMPERRGEYRSASPLRDLHNVGPGGERAATASGGPAFKMGGVVVNRIAPRASLEVPSSSAGDRAIDARRTLHLHAIRNGYLSKAANHNNQSSAPRPSSPSSSSHSFFFSFCSSALRALSFPSLSALFRTSAARRDPRVRPAAIYFRPAPIARVADPSRLNLPQLELIGVSL
ncbi:MAG: hypothetical protein RIF32_23050 [Leptospirales bacterium]|jgi:hypothetical protein